MPLLDHFHPPLGRARHWESFHARWATAIADRLNQLLPPQYFAEIHVHVGSRVEVDVATFDQGPSRATSQTAAVAPVAANGGAVATVPRVVSSEVRWSPPEPDFVMPAVYPDSVEVLVYNSEAMLVAAVELVSPGNKGRAETRKAFAAKCATYLQQGVGLVTVDVVTERQGNLHNELVELLGVGDRFLLAPDPLFAVAYRPVRREVKRDEPLAEEIHIWHATVAVGQPLPLLPLALDRQMCVPLDLESTYTEARQRSRLT